MHNMLAVARRILAQFHHDPRTLALLIVAPCIVLWLFSVLLGVGAYTPRLAIVSLPQDFQTALVAQNTVVKEVDTHEAERLLQNNEVDAVISLNENTLSIKVEGADVSRTGASLTEIQAALVKMQEEKVSEAERAFDAVSLDIPEETLALFPDTVQETLSEARASIPDFSDLMPITGFEVSYLHGNEDWTSFDFFGPVFIGIFIFVFVFMTSSMSLLTERSGGTMERFLMTPIKSWQIVGGYSIGFGLITLVQSIIIIWASISLIGFPNEGSLFLVALITVSMAIVSLTLGLLVSGLANTPFQVIQLMIVFIVPQILLSGIFDLSQTPLWMQTIAGCFPIYYGAEALRDVMLRGASFGEIALHFSVLWGFIVVFFGLSCLSFRKKRAKIQNYRLDRKSKAQETA